MKKRQMTRFLAALSASALILMGGILPSSRTAAQMSAGAGSISENISTTENGQTDTAGSAQTDSLTTTEGSDSSETAGTDGLTTTEGSDTTETTGTDSLTGTEGSDSTETAGSTQNGVLTSSAGIVQTGSQGGIGEKEEQAKETKEKKVEVDGKKVSLEEAVSLYEGKTSELEQEISQLNQEVAKNSSSRLKAIFILSLISIIFLIILINFLIRNHDLKLDLEETESDLEKLEEKYILLLYPEMKKQKLTQETKGKTQKESIEIMENAILKDYTSKAKVSEVKLSNSSGDMFAEEKKNNVEKGKNSEAEVIEIRSSKIRKLEEKLRGQKELRDSDSLNDSLPIEEQIALREQGEEEERTERVTEETNEPAEPIKEQNVKQEQLRQKEQNAKQEQPRSKEQPRQQEQPRQEEQSTKQEQSRQKERNVKKERTFEGNLTEKSETKEGLSDTEKMLLGDFPKKEKKVPKKSVHSKPEVRKIKKQEKEFSDFNRKIEPKKEEAVVLEENRNQEASGREILKKEISPKDASSKEVSPKEVSPKDASSKEVSPKDVSSKEASKKEASKKEVSKKRAFPKEVPLKEAPKIEASQKEPRQKTEQQEILEDVARNVLKDSQSKEKALKRKEKLVKKKGKKAPETEKKTTKQAQDSKEIRLDDIPMHTVKEELLDFEIQDSIYQSRLDGRTDAMEYRPAYHMDSSPAGFRLGDTLENNIEQFAKEELRLSEMSRRAENIVLDSQEPDGMETEPPMDLQIDPPRARRRELEKLDIDMAYEREKSLDMEMKINPLHHAPEPKNSQGSDVEIFDLDEI